MTAATTANEVDAYNIAYIDIETFPNLGFVWAKYDQDVISFEREWYIASFSVKWEGSKKVETYALPDFWVYTLDPFDDSELVKKLWEVLDKADLVVAHNGDKFDLRKANARFLLNGMLPPSPYKSFDTLKELRKRFAMTSNRLGDVCERLFGASKIKVDKNLWLGCIRNDPKDWAKMKKYNAMDVVLLEKLYKRIRAWSVTHPDITCKDATATTYHCPVCGGTRLEKRGWSPAKTYRRRRYHCLNPKCGKYSLGETEKIPGLHLA